MGSGPRRSPASSVAQRPRIGPASLGHSLAIRGPLAVEPLRILLVLQTLAICPLHRGGRLQETASACSRSSSATSPSWAGLGSSTSTSSACSSYRRCGSRLAIASGPLASCSAWGALWGSFFLCPYLLWASLAARGDLATLLTGESARSP